LAAIEMLPANLLIKGTKQNGISTTDYEASVAVSWRTELPDFTSFVYIASTSVI